MDASFFISRRLRFKGTVVMACVAISYLVMIIAVSVSSGFRKEIRDGLSYMSGDVQITPPNMNILDSSRPIESDKAYIDRVEAVDGVEQVLPVIYRAGILKEGDEIHGIMIKGVEGGFRRVAPEADGDSLSLAVAIPRRLSEITGVQPGEPMTVYFIGEKVKLRRFNVAAVYDALIETDDRLVVYADLSDMQRLEGWGCEKVSAVEVVLDDEHKDALAVHRASSEISDILNVYSEQSESPVIAVSSVSRYPQLFDWLNLIDFNVLFILLLMTVVAGFNMISGLLIMLFENISTIGLLKALGMRDRAISKVFLSSAAVLVLKGMAIGNILAFIFCSIQQKTHILKLDPENYFVSFVPVDINLSGVLMADVVSFAAIMLLLLIPTLFISRVDPAQTVRVK